MSIKIRRAKAEDKDFLINAIIQAEKSGSDIISYCAIFDISLEELKSLLSAILDEDAGGQELCIGNFLIAEVDNNAAAAISGWVEMEDGIASNIIKSSLLMQLLDRDKLFKAAPNLRVLNEINIIRQQGAIQLECVYTCEQFRGMGLVRKLIDEHIALAGKELHKAQILLLKNNLSAIRAYEKAGFRITGEKSTDNETILKLFPCNTRILMEKNII